VPGFKFKVRILYNKKNVRLSYGVMGCPLDGGDKAFGKNCMPKGTKGKNCILGQWGVCGTKI